MQQILPDGDADPAKEYQQISTVLIPLVAAKKMLNTMAPKKEHYTDILLFNAAMADHLYRVKCIAAVIADLNRLLDCWHKKMMVVGDDE